MSTKNLKTGTKLPKKTVELTPEELLADLASKWKEYDTMKREAEAERKAIEADMRAVVEKHESRLLGDKQTTVVGDLRIGYSNASKLILAKHFDVQAFANRYPKLVEIKPKLSPIKGFVVGDDAKAVEFHDLGITIEEETSFGVSKV